MDPPNVKTYADIWSSILQLLSEKGQMTPVTLATWFDDAVLQEFDGDRAVVMTTHDIKKDIIVRKYLGALKDAFRELFSADIDITVMTPEEYEVHARKKQASNEPAEEEFSFSTFVVGPSNKFAHAAAIAVAKNPATTYNPLFIYGPSGLGKTHLLGAIAGEFKHAWPNRTAVYITSEDFTNEMISFISRNRMQEFRDKYRAIDLLLVDDIQFIAGKDSTMEEFFHTFNALDRNHKQIVLTSDRTPKEIPRLEERLVSRFEMGLLADVSPPDYETRCAIVMAKAKHLRIDLLPEIVDFIARKITNNVRQLEGTVKKMMALNIFMGAPIDLSTAERAIEDIFRENPGLNPTPAYIISHVSAFFGVPEKDIVGQKRDAETMQARHVAIYITRVMTGLSLQDIGDKFDRDHSTVRSSLARTEEMLTTSASFKTSINNLIKTIREG